MRRFVSKALEEHVTCMSPSPPTCMQSSNGRIERHVNAQHDRVNNELNVSWPYALERKVMRDVPSCL